MTAVATRRRTERAATSLRTGFVFFALVHGALVATAVLFGLRQAPPAPPIYRIEMIGAPAGPRQAGVV